MKNENQNMNALIALYLNNELTGDEKQLIESWSKEHPEEFDFLVACYSRKLSPIHPDVDEAWNRVNKDVAGRKRKYRPYVWYASVAAVLVFLIGLFLFYPHDGRQNGILAGNVTGSFESGSGLRECSLPDGSKVILKNNSRLSYDWSNDGMRQTTLEGEAFFKVVHNEKKEFSVRTGGLDVRVLGTSFVINARKEAGNEVVWVESGKVKVRALNERQNLVLVKGESSMFENGFLKRIPTDDLNQYGWATKVLVFDNRPLTEVIAAVEQNFTTRIDVADAHVAACLVTARFENESLDAIVRELSAITGFSYEKTSKGYRITHIQCP